MPLKTKYTTSVFKPWKEKVYAKVEEKIMELKKINLSKQKQYWITQMLKSTWKNSIENLLLSSLIKHKIFFHICIKYYISKLLAEVSPNKKNSASTYSQTLKSKEKTIKTNIKYCKKVDLK